jgi:hypothetical protein
MDEKRLPTSQLDSQPIVDYGWAISRSFARDGFAYANPCALQALHFGLALGKGGDLAPGLRVRFRQSYLF